MSTGARFAAVGAVNTLIDVGLFLLLHDRLGIVAANAVSTSAGMASSFVVNGRFTFGASHLTLRQGALFLATTGTTMWLVQPLTIQVLLRAGERIGTYPGAPVVLIAKLLAIAVSVVLNFVACRYVVWRPTTRAEIVRSGRPQPQP